MNGLIFISIIILSIIIGIMYHEYGHMKAALKRNIKVTEYCIGMGKKIFSHKGKNGITYSLALIPMGGYCDIDDEQLKNSSTKDYISVLGAGVGRNLIIATVLTVIGKMILNNDLNILNAFKETIIYALQLFNPVIDSIGMMFDIPFMAEQGGMITQFDTIKNNVNTLNISLRQIIGLGLYLGGGMNFILSYFNMLPIPAIDGGQIVIRLICDLIKKFGKTPNYKLINRINTLGLIFLLSLQGIFTLMDIPQFRNFILLLCGK